MNPPGASRAICGQCTVGGGPAGYRSRSFAQASQRCHAVSNSALASSSVGTFPLVTMPVLGFTYTVIDQHQRMSAGVLKPGNLVYAANRLAVVEDRPVLPVRIDRGVLAEQRLDDLKAALADMGRQRDDMEKQRDKWETQAQRLALAAPKPAETPATPMSWWRWLRTTG
jgi:hypothetical protein